MKTALFLLIGILLPHQALASPGCSLVSDPGKRAICRAASGDRAAGCSLSSSTSQRAICRALRDGRR